ncbi:MAG: hypothetical protein ACLPQS_15140 [Acidimicrobiales bacterium]
MPTDSSIEENDWAITDAELAALAMAADPEAPLDPDAVPFAHYTDGSSTLPDWYMPPVSARGGRRWFAAVAIVIIAALVFIEIAGLCSTYGPIQLH